MFGGGWSIRGRSGESRDQFWIRERRTNTLSLKGKDGLMAERVPYDGMVYCASVPNGTLVVRRNGIACVAGNCFTYATAVLAWMNPKWLKTRALK